VEPIKVSKFNLGLQEEQQQNRWASLLFHVQQQIVSMPRGN